jgi:lipid II:glycine glycyltransferase (peptidoglycan interpeptide bridge formation enzyme)
MTTTTAGPAIREHIEPYADVAAEPTTDWDALAVDRPGGHVLQSRAWAEHRRETGWVPRFVSVDDHRVLALTRSWPIVPGGSAYVPRGPAPTTDPETLGRVLWSVTKALARDGNDVVAADPEVPAADEAWRRWLRRARFAAIEEIQPSRHRITLPLGAGADEAAVLSGVAKGTRQRIRKAEKQGVAVVRHDARWGAERDAGREEDDRFARPEEGADLALDRFYDLLLETGERRGFSFGPRPQFIGWWRRAVAAGHLVYLEARDGSARGDPLAGLVLYRHGARLSTVHSGDHASARQSHPGALHLLRWRAIQLAIAERCSEMDLGGVDVPGARRAPREGEPMHGLMEHKLSFGGQWLELAGAHERIIRPSRYRAGRLLSGVSRRLRLPVR